MTNHGVSLQASLNIIYVHGRQFLAYKILKGVNNNENGTENLNIIAEQELIDHYKALSYNDNIKADHSNIETNNYVIHEGRCV